ncbi:MAG: glycosyltransferase family 9 protein [Planctomycetes bacterium]|nr:glycosyltransferase family 9 protein [Planctomycetota bacterium]
MRKADRWLGVPACWALTLWRRLTSRAAPSPARPTRILFVKLAEQGSTVLAAAAIREAVRRVGRENVFFLVFEKNRFILDVMDLIPRGNAVTINDRSLWGTLCGALGAVRRMRSLKIDAVIDMEFFARSSAAMAFLCGARWRVGYHAFHGEAAYRGDLMTHRLSFNAHQHTSSAFLSMVMALDARIEQLPALDFTVPRKPDPLPAFEPSPGEADAVAALLRSAGVKEGAALVLFNANCSDLLPLRRWPSERYVELAKQLLGARPDVAIAFTGAPDEAAAAVELVGQINSPRCVSLAGKTTLRQLLVLYGLSRVLVTNDSGPAHFAALTPIHVVVLFGPETPALFAPISPRTHALWVGLACSPCVNAYNDRQSSCRNNLCMQRITMDEVLAKVTGVLDAPDSPAEARV